MIDLANLKELVEAIEERLGDEVFVVVHRFERDARPLNLALTARLRARCRKGRVWQSKAFLSALKNAEYGFETTSPRSRGGRDGLFLLDRTFRPKNEMMRKLFDRFIDREGSGIEAIAGALDATIGELLPVRLVSHHLRLLGVLHRTTDDDWLVLVDFDDTK